MFKTRAAKIQKALVDAGCYVQINASKPRKGRFVLTQASSPRSSESAQAADEIVRVELLDLPRPFTKLRNLDLEEVLEKLLAEVQEV